MKPCMLVACICAAPLVAMFGFVGWFKAFAPQADLAMHHAWTVYLPQSLGRLVGWSEMLCAVALCGVLAPATRRYARISGWVLLVNQIIAAAVHAGQGENGALPQNAVLGALALAVALMARDQQNRNGKDQTE